jgi:hypothetical protein
MMFLLGSKSLEFHLKDPLSESERGMEYSPFSIRIWDFGFKYDIKNV